MIKHRSLVAKRVYLRAAQKQEDFKESLSHKMAEYELELYEKDKRLQELENGVVNFKARAIDEAKTSTHAILKSIA